MSKKPKMPMKEAFHEVMTNPPAVVKQTEKKKGKAAARKQEIAIALSKAGKGKK